MFSPAILLSLLICLSANARVQNALYIFIFVIIVSPLTGKYLYFYFQGTFTPYFVDNSGKI